MNVLLTLCYEEDINCVRMAPHPDSPSEAPLHNSVVTPDLPILDYIIIWDAKKVQNSTIIYCEVQEEQRTQRPGSRKQALKCKIKCIISIKRESLSVLNKEEHGELLRQLLI